MVGRRGENFGVEKRWKKKIMQAGRVGFSFIRKMISTGSSATGALVAAGSLQLCSSSAQYVTLQKIYLTSKFRYLFVQTPTNKTKIGTGTANRWERLLVANRLDKIVMIGWPVRTIEQ